MRRWGVVMAGVGWRWWAGAGVAEEVPEVDEVTLPKWSEEDRKAAKEPGALIPGQALLWGHLDAEGPPPAAPEVALEVVPPPPDPKEVPEAFIDRYFAERPKAFLVDPQGLLGEKGGRDQEAFLEYHSGDSEIDLFVYLFDREQEIPGNVREEEIVERFFSEGKPAVVVYYYLGAPERADILVSPLLSDSVSAGEQRRALETSLAQANEKRDAAEQFEAFCVQMSIRLYWMERAAGLVKTEPVMVAELPKEEKKEASKGVPWRDWVEVTRPWWGVAGCGVAGVLAMVALLWSWKRRVRYRFPEFEIPPRLGGAHGAGIGAVMSFGSTSKSPVDQRRQVPDYLADL